MEIVDRRVPAAPIATRAALVPRGRIAAIGGIAVPVPIVALAPIVVLVPIAAPVPIVVFRATVPIGIGMPGQIVPTEIEAPAPRRRPSGTRPRHTCRAPIAGHATRGAIVRIAPASRARAKVRRAGSPFQRRLRSDAFARFSPPISRRP